MKTIEEAPLQIYVSALVFSPSQSIVRRLYSDEEPSWITFRPRQSAMWDACLYTTDSVLCVALSPITSADQFATVSGDSQIIIWDLNSLTRTKTINTTLILQCLTYSVDGRQLVSFGLESDQTGTVLVWDISTWSCVKTIPRVPVLSSFRTLANGDIAGIEMVYRRRFRRIPRLVIRIHDATQPPRGRPLMDVELPELGDLWVEFAPHRRLLACSTGSSISIQRLDAEERNLAALLEAESVAAIAFSSDEMSLFSASTEGSVCEWNLGNLDNISSHDFAKASGGIVDMECSSNGEFLATGSLHDTIRMWSIATGECVRRVHAQGASISSLAISPTGRHAVSRGLWGRAKVWDMTLNHGVDHSAQEAQTDRNELRVSPDGQMVVFLGGDSVEIWHTALHARIHCLDTSSIGGFSPDSRYYAVDDHDGREWRTVIQTINGAQHVIDTNWPTTGWPIVWCADAVDGPLFARTTRDQRNGIWRPARTSGPQVIAPRGKDSRLRPLGFSPGGKWLITTSSSGLQMWDVDAERLVCGVESTKHEWTSSVAISHNHDRLVVNKGLGIAIWDLAKQKGGTGIVLSRTIDLQLYPEAIAFSPIGDIIACTGYDYIVSTKEYRHRLAVVNLNTASTLTKTFVGPYEYIEPSFDDSGMTLRTSLRLIDMKKIIAKWKVEETATTEDVAEDFYQATTRYDLDQTRQWVVKDGSRTLQLPPDYADASRMPGTS
jgi:WD40 repeat protein